MFLTTGLALSGALGPFRPPLGSAPLRMGMVLLALALGTGLTVVLDRPGPRPFWQLALAATLVLMPITSLQAYASRVPFVAISRGSAGPLLSLTVAAALALVALWLFTIYQTEQEPENAVLLFLPVALLVPAIFGAPGSIGETAALTMLGEAALVGGVATFIGLLAPPSWRPLTGAATLGAQFVLLWTLGRGPVIGHDDGMVVPIGAAVLLVLTALLTVLAPLGALFCHRFLQEVEGETGAPQVASVPARGARRREDD
jgi:hypothetical protein